MLMNRASESYQSFIIIILLTFSDQISNWICTLLQPILSYPSNLSCKFTSIRK